MITPHAYRAAATAALLLGSLSGYCQKGSVTDDPVMEPGFQTPNVVNAKWMPPLAANVSYARTSPVASAIPYQPVRQEDVLWAKTVWREIDMLQKQNLAFRYEGDENTGGGMFSEIIIDAIKRGKVTAYSAANGDDRFTKKLTKEEVIELITPKPLEYKVDMDGEMERRIVKREFDPHHISKLRVKEEWTFNRSEGKMVSRIIGIAPIMDVFSDDENIYKGSYALFWIPFPELRNVLAGYEVFSDPSNVNRFSWDDFFEQRMFGSAITKVSNVMNQRYEDIYGTDARGKMEALYEGQRYSNELFNQEHDKWEY